MEVISGYSYFRETSVHERLRRRVQNGTQRNDIHAYTSKEHQGLNTDIYRPYLHTTYSGIRVAQGMYVLQNVFQSFYVSVNPKAELVSTAFSFKKNFSSRLNSLRSFLLCPFFVSSLSLFFVFCLFCFFVLTPILTPALTFPLFFLPLSIITK